MERIREMEPDAVHDRRVQVASGHAAVVSNLRPGRCAAVGAARPHRIGRFHEAFLTGKGRLALPTASANSPSIEPQP